jgi:hypothetical protein
VKDLIAGSGIRFEDFGTYHLKGISDSWQLLRVVQASSQLSLGKTTSDVRSWRKADISGGRSQRLSFALPR